jgi:hypothetical protein
MAEGGCSLMGGDLLKAKVDLSIILDARRFFGFLRERCPEKTG